MRKLSRRKLITTGLGAVASASGLAVAARLAGEYGLIPPDGSGIFGPGTTLTYASHRLLTRHLLAREFPRSRIPKAPFANGTPPEDAAYRRSRGGAFADWRLTVDGLVANPVPFSLAELRILPASSQITHLACEEGWSYIAEWIEVECVAYCRPRSRLVGRHETSAACGRRAVRYSQKGAHSGSDTSPDLA